MSNSSGSPGQGVQCTTSVDPDTMDPPSSPAPHCPFPPDALPLPPQPGAQEPATTSLPEQYTLPHTKAIDLIGEEFVVSSLKTEPSECVVTEPVMVAVSRPSVVMSVSAATHSDTAAVTRDCTDQSNLVYCNLNDLDFTSGTEGGVYTTMGSNNMSNMQEMIITTSAPGLLQMVQSVPCFQVAGQQDKSSPYSAVSTILLQGGILQVMYMVVMVAMHIDVRSHFAYGFLAVDSKQN